MTDQKKVQDLFVKARVAQVEFETYTQADVDEIVTAIAWAGYQQENAERLAQLAYEGSRLGNYEDKVTKIRRKTKGTLMDLKGAKSVGVVEVDDTRGLTKIAKPMGVVAAILPATNPAATAVNNMMITLKGRNAVILAPHPRGEAACAEAVRLARAELAKLKVPQDLIQYCSLQAENKAAGKARSAALMNQADFVLVTAGPNNVALGYSSGTPAHGVGLGNAPVILDETANIAGAIPKIVASKTFDFATSCSSENSLVIEASIYDQVLEALEEHGGYVVKPEEKAQLQDALWPDGHLSREVVAQSPQKIAELAGLSEATEARLLVVKEEGIGPEYPFSGEKLCVVLTVYKYHDFAEAIEKVQRILAYMGLGHSCGIHSHNEAHIKALADQVKVSTVLVNQPHCYNNGGGFDNGLDFTLSMGAGTWGENGSSDNLTYKHFLNYTYLAQTIPNREPTDEELWGEFLAKQAEPMAG